MLPAPPRVSTGFQHHKNCEEQNNELTKLNPFFRRRAHSGANSRLARMINPRRTEFIRAKTHSWSTYSQGRRVVYTNFTKKSSPIRQRAALLFNTSVGAPSYKINEGQIDRNWKSFNSGSPILWSHWKKPQRMLIQCRSAFGFQCSGESSGRVRADNQMMQSQTFGIKKMHERGGSLIYFVLRIFIFPSQKLGL